MDYVPYYNDMLARLEEQFFHELWASGAKVEFVGIDYIQSKNITGNTLAEVVGNCVKAIKEDGIVKDMSYAIHPSGMLLKLNVKGCIHMPKEVKVRRDGITPYLCPIANMIVDRVYELLDYESIILIQAEGSRIIIDEKKGECEIKCAMYETMDKVGQVSDWTKF